MKAAKLLDNISLALVAARLGRFAKSNNFHAPDLKHFVMLQAFDVAAGLDGGIDDDAARLHLPHHLGGDDHGCFASENLSSRNHDVRGRDAFGQQFALFLDLLRGERLCVAIGSLGNFADIEFDEAGSQRFYLLLDDRGACRMPPRWHPIGAPSRWLEARRRRLRSRIRAKA